VTWQSRSPQAKWSQVRILPPTKPLRGEDRGRVENVSSDWQGLEQRIDEVLTNNSELVQEWLRDAPGSWGALAGRAVIAHRDAVGSPLNDRDGARGVAAALGPSGRASAYREAPRLTFRAALSLSAADVSAARRCASLITSPIEAVWAGNLSSRTTQWRLCSPPGVRDEPVKRGDSRDSSINAPSLSIHITAVLLTTTPS
jgi:hypothetical protein